MEHWLPKIDIEEKVLWSTDFRNSKVTEKPGYKVTEQVWEGKLQVEGLQADNRKQE